MRLEKMNSLVERRAAYVDAAQENVHYLLGRNTFSLSFVTRVGDNPLAEKSPNKRAWRNLAYVPRAK